MAKTKISEFSAIPANNTDIDSINIAEGCAPSGINDAIRELMAQLKDWQSGTSNDPYVVGSSGSLTLNQGTANGVPYLNGSKVVTSGSVLTFDGAILGVNGVSVGRGGGAVATNVAVGASSLAGTNTGTLNTGIGQQALSTNTSGAQNTAVGGFSLYSNTTGSSNTAVGAGVLGSFFGALGLNTTGANNTAIGQQALYSNTTASSNTAVGYQAAYTNTTGGTNTAMGYQALYSNTTAGSQVAYGYQALYANTTGQLNTAIGTLALAANTTGSNNIAIGYQSLQANTTASNNTAVGYQAGYSNTTGAQNTFVGQGAGYSNSTGSDNAYFGRDAGTSLTTGSSNTLVGRSAGESITTGGKNTIVGRYTGNQGGLDIRTANNYIVLSDGDGNPRFSSATGNAYIGSSPASVATLSLTGVGGGGYISGGRNSLYLKNTNASGNQSNSFVFGSAGTANSIEMMNDVNANGTTINQLNIFAGGSGGVYLASGGTSWTAVSDERTKDIIEPITDALAKVSTLRTVIGKYKTDAADRRRVFLIAQDVQAVLPEAVTVGTDELNTIGLSYADTIPLLVAAIKELKAEIETLKGQA
jgi:hypothetical protein